MDDDDGGIISSAQFSYNRRHYNSFLPSFKQEIVVLSCIDPGQVRRDLESLLRTVTMIVATDLNMQSENDDDDGDDDDDDDDSRD